MEPLEELEAHPRRQEPNRPNPTMERSCHAQGQLPWAADEGLEMLGVLEAPLARRRTAGDDAVARLELQLVDEIGVDVVTEFGDLWVPVAVSGLLGVDRVVEGMQVQPPGRRHRP